MKECPNCRNQITDSSVFCPVCGTAVGIAPQFSSQEKAEFRHKADEAFNPPPIDAPTAPYIDPFDHTSIFESADISENKPAVMLAYLLGPFGILIALLSSGDSAYARFHIKQSMKLTVAEILGIVLIAVASYIMWSIRLRMLMFFVVIASFAALVILHLLCFYQVCKGKAVEVYIVRNLRFLK